MTEVFWVVFLFFFFQAEDGIRDHCVTGVQTCALPIFTGAFAAILKGAADEMRAVLLKLPEGQSTAEGLLDSDGIDVDKPLKLAVTVSIKDGIASIDFSASDPQARGPVNL